MATLLHVNSSPMGGASITRSLSNEFVRKWREANPAGEVITRDLTTSELTGIDAGWIGASYTPAGSLTPAQNELLALSDTLIGELQRADEWVFGIPMHNFSVTASFKLWLDQIVRAGKTFSYVDGVPSGLLKNKKAYFVIASGAMYEPGSPMAPLDFVRPYLRTIFGFMGVTDLTFHGVGGVAAINSGKINRQSFLQPHVDSIRAQFQPA